MDVEIEYCVPCGLLDKAIEVERMLLAEFGSKLDSVRLRTGSGGVFKVRADAEEIFDSKRDGWDPARISADVAERITVPASAEVDGAGRTLPLV
jgi:selenoprotein W-related protein